MIEFDTIPEPEPPKPAAPRARRPRRAKPSVAKKKPDMITPAQMRAGRALLGWSQQQLADAAAIGLASVNNYERGASDPRLSTLREARDAMAKAGVIFIEPAGGEGEGAKLSRPSPIKKGEGARMAKPDDADG